MKRGTKVSDLPGDHEAVEPKAKNPMLNDKWYAILEYNARVTLPAAAVLYLALSSLWSFPNPAEVVGTIVAIDTFLGVFLGFAQKAYDASDAAYNGSLNILPNNGGKLFSLDLAGDPNDLETLNKVTFKVNSQLTP